MANAHPVAHLRHVPLVAWLLSGRSLESKQIMLGHQFGGHQLLLDCALCATVVPNRKLNRL